MINNLITFDFSGTADTLCSLNNWDKSTLRLHALELGLKYKQADVVESALNSTDIVYLVRAVGMVLEDIRGSKTAISEEVSVENLFNIGTVALMRGVRRLTKTAADLTPDLLSALQMLETFRSFHASLTMIPKSESVVCVLFPETEKPLPVTADRACDDTINLRYADLPLGEPLRRATEPLVTLDLTGIVREALLSGNMSTAVGYFGWRGGRCDQTLEWFRRAQACIVFQELLRGEYALASLMLRNAGDRHVLDTLLGVVFRTTHKHLRWQLLSFIEATFGTDTTYERIFFRREKDYLRLLETLYEGTSFYREYERLTAVDHGPDVAFTSLDQAFTCGEVNDFAPAVKQRYNFISQWEETFDLYRDTSSQLVLPAPPPPRVDAKGYLLTSIAWIAQWPAETKERVLLECGHAQSRSADSNFSYYLSCNDWDKAREQLTVLVGECDKSCVVPLSRCGRIQEAFRHATPLMQQLALTECARLGGVAADEWPGITDTHGKKEVPAAALRRLAEARALFCEPSFLPEWAVVASLTALGAFGAACEYAHFHRLRSKKCPSRMRAANPWLYLSVSCVAASAEGVDSIKGMLHAGCLNACLVLHRHAPGEAPCNDQKLLDDFFGGNGTREHPLLLLALSQYLPTLVRCTVPSFPTWSNAIVAACDRAAQMQQEQQTAEPTFWNPDLKSGKEDVSLSSLLREPDLFRRLVTLARQVDSFIDVELAFLAHKYEIDLRYFLGKGHATQALLHFPHPPDNVWDYTRRIALANHGNALLVCACVCYLELHNIDSLPLRVDVCAAALVARYADPPAELLPAFAQAAADSKQAERLLRLLERAAGLASGGDPDHRVWSILPLLCEVHGLGSACALTGHLSDVARTSNCFSFLRNAHAFGATGAELLDVLLVDWPHRPSKEHLLLALAPLLPSHAAAEVAAVSGDPGTMRELPRNSVRAAQFMDGPGADAWAPRLPPLLVLAKHQRAKLSEKRTAASLFVAWLHASFPALVPSLAADPGGMRAAQAAAVEALIRERKFVSLEAACQMFFAPLHPFLCLSRFFKGLLQYRFKEAWEVFSLFRSSSEAEEKAEAEDGGDSQQQDMAKGEATQEPLSCHWIKAIALRCITHCLRHFFDTGCYYSLWHTLCIIFTSGFASGIEQEAAITQQYNTFQLLRRTSLPISLLLSPAKTIVGKLVDAELFDEAVQYCAASGVDVLDVLLTQARSELWQFKHSRLWHIPHERVNLWRKFHGLFLQHNPDNEAVGDFFLDQSVVLAAGANQQAASASAVVSAPQSPTSPTGDGASTPSAVEPVAVNAEEQLELLVIAYSWYAGQPAHYEPGDTALPAASGAGVCLRKHAAFMKELETRIVLLSVIIAAGLPPILPVLEQGSSQQEGGGWSGAVLLDTVIGQLIGAKKWVRANEISRQFHHSCLDLVVTNSLLAVALGGLTADSADAIFSPQLLAALRDIGQADRLAEAIAQQDAPDAMDALLRLPLSQSARTGCNAIVADYKVAIALRRDFGDVREASKLEVLRALLVQCASGPISATPSPTTPTKAPAAALDTPQPLPRTQSQRLALCAELVACYPEISKDVPSVLADHFLECTLDPSTRTSWPRSDFAEYTSLCTKPRLIAARLFEYLESHNSAAAVDTLRGSSSTSPSVSSPTSAVPTPDSTSPENDVTRSYTPPCRTGHSLSPVQVDERSKTITLPPRQRGRGRDSSTATKTDVAVATPQKKSGSATITSPSRFSVFSTPQHPAATPSRTVITITATPSSAAAAAAAASPAYTAALEVETELLVAAYTCYEQDACAVGMQRAIDYIHSHIDTYETGGHFRLLLRLLKGTRAYRDLSVIFGILIENNHFELFLRRDKYSESDDVGLQVELLDYLKRCRPNDLESLNVALLRFGLHNELAALYEQRATQLLLRYFPAEPATMPVMPPGTLQRRLDNITRTLEEAENFYIKDRAFSDATRVRRRAVLVALQLRRPDARLLNLSPEAARRAFCCQTSFADALSIANAHDLAPNALDWVPAVYNQAVAAANMPFFAGLAQHHHITAEFYWAMAQRFQEDPQRERRGKQFRVFLATVDDLFLRFDLASELGFTDVSNHLLTAVKGLRHFRRDEPRAFKRT
eukprot:TRINITY_DN659_c0_g4_i1.p1 TRINITY_DN659_c0_g4~~TRINITY_DN659_c0_g4_i1.p1  ORF type:complete len:2254 (+),score=550.99 TRINITY_DN659_c0_g4_i1:429-6764(+)